MVQQTVCRWARSGFQSRNVSPGKEVALRRRVENCSVGVTRRIVTVSFMVRSGMEPEGRLRIDRDDSYRGPDSPVDRIMTRKAEGFRCTGELPGTKSAADAGRSKILPGRPPLVRVSLDSSGATGTDYLYNPFRFISSIEFSYRSACTCWPSTHRANCAMPASNDQRGENPSSRRAFEMSAKLWRMSPCR